MIINYDELSREDSIEDFEFYLDKNQITAKITYNEYYLDVNIKGVRVGSWRIANETPKLCLENLMSRCRGRFYTKEDSFWRHSIPDQFPVSFKKWREEYEGVNKKKVIETIPLFKRFLNWAKL